MLQHFTAAILGMAFGVDTPSANWQIGLVIQETGVLSSWEAAAFSCFSAAGQLSPCHHVPSEPPCPPSSLWRMLGVLTPLPGRTNLLQEGAGSLGWWGKNLPHMPATSPDPQLPPPALEEQLLWGTLVARRCGEHQGRSGEISGSFPTEWLLQTSHRFPLARTGHTGKRGRGLWFA